MYRPKVSIIVPVYNSEKYLRKCIESILSQQLQEIELILVNDGSYDSSLNIIKEYERIDSRIVLIDQTNKGVSQARNRGVLQSKGDYIAFVDSDDYVKKEIYEEMYNEALVNNSDIIVCGCDIISDKKTVKTQHFNLKKTYDLEKMEIITFLKTVFLKNEYRKSCWNKLYKGEIIRNKIFFENYNEVLSEDTLFNFNVIINANIISIVPKSLYNHRMIEGSLSNSKTFKNVSQRNVCQMNLMYNLLKQNTRFRYEILYRFFYLQGLSNIAELEINHNMKNLRSLIKEISHYRKFCKKNHEKTHNNVTKIIDDKQKKIFYYMLNFFDNLNSNYLIAILLLLKTKKRMTINES